MVTFKEISGSSFHRMSSGQLSQISPAEHKAHVLSCGPSPAAALLDGSGSESPTRLSSSCSGC